MQFTITSSDEMHPAIPIYLDVEGKIETGKMIDITRVGAIHLSRDRTHQIATANIFDKEKEAKVRELGPLDFFIVAKPRNPKNKFTLSPPVRVP